MCNSKQDKPSSPEPPSSSFYYHFAAEERESQQEKGDRDCFRAPLTTGGYSDDYPNDGDIRGSRLGRARATGNCAVPGGDVSGGGDNQAEANARVDQTLYKILDDFDLKATHFWILGELGWTMLKDNSNSLYISDSPYDSFPASRENSCI
ncbi:hypothetical protein PtA15_8A50 [Puccinia triticina]|uniref:Uncharacterized protein n=1 Tax=Puccinia triticina TaxID=208348 RepID=A0ABY7CPG0_9BASI|nr:uncharacterized protein PtA15_8A50 [Puccinia triticina]WAQ87149.1 hypothetical protein PtA15_8A50 [Puccinia triticina]WAR57011.1 hypothetical protein PtB15_8B55 [Puccinia triticina]